MTDMISKLLKTTNWNVAGIAFVVDCKVQDVWEVVEDEKDRRLRECLRQYREYVHGLEENPDLYRYKGWV